VPSRSTTGRGVTTSTRRRIPHVAQSRISVFAYPVPAVCANASLGCASPRRLALQAWCLSGGSAPRPSVLRHPWPDAAAESFDLRSGAGGGLTAGASRPIGGSAHWRGSRPPARSGRRFVWRSRLAQQERALSRRAQDHICWSTKDQPLAPGRRRASKNTSSSVAADPRSTTRYQPRSAPGGPLAGIGFSRWLAAICAASRMPGRVHQLQPAAQTLRRSWLSSVGNSAV